MRISEDTVATVKYPGRNEEMFLVHNNTLNNPCKTMKEFREKIENSGLIFIHATDNNR